MSQKPSGNIFDTITKAFQNFVDVGRQKNDLHVEDSPNADTPVYTKKETTFSRHGLDKKQK